MARGCSGNRNGVHRRTDACPAPVGSPPARTRVFEYEGREGDGGVGAAAPNATAVELRKTRGAPSNHSSMTASRSGRILDCWPTEGGRSSGRGRRDVRGFVGAGGRRR